MDKFSRSHLPKTLLKHTFMLIIAPVDCSHGVSTWHCILIAIFQDLPVSTPETRDLMEPPLKMEKQNFAAVSSSDYDIGFTILEEF
ncbi:Hypothetical predicted protein [Podarcis lilfordi]|uniref:Uncharacterized protein n=1 Tax=Podarcis lilfordi TaxID=74358 RepID=A0AA35KMY0_9SAUR|nr:Hypothetical predicted protein [Podarcis lilfordi]